MHLANFNSTNIGNGALAEGLEAIVSEDMHFPIKWQREAWDDYTFQKKDFDQGFVDQVNLTDGLIVGGAVTFNGRDYNDRTGTRFELPFELWDKITKPVVFYGLSYRHWQGEVYHHQDKLKAMVQRALDSENMILSVRNDGTKDWLAAMTGIDSPQILEVPDSAVFVPFADEDYPEIVGDVCNVILAFNDEDSQQRFGADSSDAREKVVECLVSVVEELAERYSLNIILCPHYFDDFKMMSSFIEKIKPRIAHQNMVATGLARVKDTAWFYGRYAKADLAISMRVHSMSPSIGIGTPMVAFTTQNRMSDFIRNLGLGSQAVDAIGPNARAELLEKTVFSLENGPVVRKKFAEARLQLRNQSRAFHENVADLIENTKNRG